MKTTNELCRIVRRTADDIHVYHPNGPLEKVCENALPRRLRKLGLHVKRQKPVKVYDEAGAEIGDGFADWMVGGRLIVDLKAARTIMDEHVAQMLGYLKAARIENGLLINFRSYRFQIRKSVLTQGKAREERPNHFAGLVPFFFVFFAFFRGY
jgi:GxxExxY protein